MWILLNRIAETGSESGEHNLRMGANHELTNGKSVTCSFVMAQKIVAACTNHVIGCEGRGSCISGEPANLKVRIRFDSDFESIKHRLLHELPIICPGVVSW